MQKHGNFRLQKNTFHSFFGGSPWYKIPENLKELKMYASKPLRCMNTNKIAFWKKGCGKNYIKSVVQQQPMVTKAPLLKMFYFNHA
jgi:hypothetical protein